MRAQRDTVLLFVTLILVGVGFFIFFSAALSLLARDSASLTRVISTQFIFGIVGGGIALYTLMHIPYRYFKAFAPHVFVISLFITALVFTPLGQELHGAKRWIDIFGFSFQPSEVLKIATILFLARVLSVFRKQFQSLKYGLLPFVAVIALPILLLLFQPDNDTAALLLVSCFAMYFVEGAPWRDVGIVVLVALVGIVGILTVHPYAMERMQSYLAPTTDPLGSGYHIQQSLIAVGSGGVLGKGVGQSAQKWNYLPEPMSDSIFAVYAEETGFVGSVIAILLFLLFITRGLAIGVQATDPFASMVAVGLSVMLVLQAFMNIASSLGLIPVAGLALTFVSHGGSALFSALVAVGIILSVSATKRHTNTL